MWLWRLCDNALVGYPMLNVVFGCPSELAMCRCKKLVTYVVFYALNSHVCGAHPRFYYSIT